MAEPLTFTFLVVNRDCPIRGNISAVQQGAGTWGVKEGLPRFRRIAFTGRRVEARWIMDNARYEFGSGMFVHTDTGEEFNPVFDLVEKEEDYTAGEVADETLATFLGRTDAIPACDYLGPDGKDSYEESLRSRWFKIYYPHRYKPGFKRLLQAARYGWYSHTRQAVRALAKSDRLELLQSMDPEDQQYLRWLCSLSPEADNI